MSAMNPVLFVLGAEDPEMNRIEEILRAVAGAGFPVRILYATADGARVRGGSAYRCDQITVERAGAEDPVLVECSPEIRAQDGAVVTALKLDHHSPGDPGYGKPPCRYWSGSSLGQVTDYLIRRLRRAGTDLPEVLGRPFPDEEDRLIAAADHCLLGAYAGMCPMVDPDRLLDHRLAVRARFLGVGLEEVKKIFNAAVSHLGRAPVFEHLGDEGGIRVRDLRLVGSAEMIPEAAAWRGEPFIAEVTDPGGRRKIVLQAAGPKVVRYAMENPEIFGIRGEIYGDPERGFMGGYLESAPKQEVAGPGV